MIAAIIFAPMFFAYLIAAVVVAHSNNEVTK